MLLERSLPEPLSKPTASLRKRPAVCIVSHDAYGAITGGKTGHIGGIQWQTTMLAKWLAREGFETTMLTWDEGGPAEETIQGVRVIKVCRQKSGLKGLRFVHPKWTGLNAALRAAHADVYYHNGAECVTGQTALWCVKHGKRFVFSTANDTDCDPQTPQLRTPWDRALYRYGLRHADALIAQTETQRKNLKQHFGLDAMVIPMPCQAADTAVTDPTPPPEPRRVLWVARVCLQKRPDRLLDLAERSPDLQFDLVGPFYTNAYAQGIRERAKGIANVTIHGGVERAKTQAFYRGALCLCCTSDYEGFPNTFLEAWSNGLPIVSTFDPDGLIAGKGLGVVAADVTALQTAIRSLAASEERRREIGARARDYFTRNHESTAVLPRFEEVFQKLMA